MGISRLLLLALLLLLPWSAVAQVVPQPPSTGGEVTFPQTTCVNQVGVGITTTGILVCAPVTAAMTVGLVPAGADVSAIGQVTSTHLATPLPVLQGGTSLAGGTPGGLLYFPTATTLASTPAFPQHAPVLGGGAGQPLTTGTRSGTTLEFATILGPHTLGKQLTFDVNGNLVATGSDVGPGAVTGVFGRTGAVIAQPGDYMAAQVTGAADLNAPNVFAHSGGQSMTQLLLVGSTSGTVTLRAPAVAGTSTFTLPAGENDFSTTGGPGQVLQQVTSGGPLTVASLAFSMLTGTATAAQVPPLPNLLGVLTTPKGGLGWTDTTFAGSTHVLATVQGILTAGMGVTSDAQGNLITTGQPPGGGSGSGTVASGGPGTLAYYPTLGTTVGDSGVVAGQVLTAAAAFTTGQVLQAAGNNRSVSGSGILASSLCLANTACPGYQASLGFTAENVANKSTSTALTGTVDQYPTLAAVKGYVDTGLGTKQNTITWGTGLDFAAGVAAVVSTESGFLTNGSATPLVCGPGTQGRLQVLASGELQYCDGATTAVLRSGLPTQSGLKWNVIPASCTGDANLGKLTINVSGEIVCAADIGGDPGEGGVTSVFGRTGVVVAQPGDYTAVQVTNAADLTAANVFTHATGQSMRQVVLPGASSGTLTLRPAVSAGTSTLTFPAGTTDFTSTGGPGQVVRQSSSGGPLTVGQLSAADLSNGVVGSGALLLATNTAIGALVNLTQNGLVRTSGGAGVLSVDTSAYLTGNQAITLSGDVSGTGTTAIPVTVTRLNGGVFSGASGNLVSFGAGNTPTDSGVTVASLVTAPSAFTTGQVLQAAGNNRTASASGILVSALCTTATVCSGYQASLGFTAVPDTRTLTFAGTTNQITVSLTGAQSLAANRSWTFSLPQNIDTGALIRHGSLGLNVAAPSTAGTLSTVAGANNVTVLTLKRATDTTPTGAFVDYQNAAGSSLWRVDITGTLTAGTVPVAFVPGAVPDTRTLTLTGTANQIVVSAGAQDLTANRMWTLSLPTNPTLPGITTGSFSGPLAGNASTATALAADPPPCGANLFANDMAANGTLGCVQPTFANLGGTALAAQLPTAAADGTTRGVAAFVATDFECTAGVCSLDYINGQAASSGTKGFLTATDWATFNAKQAALTFTPEDVARKNPSATLGTSNVDYPTQGAVKLYVDEGIKALRNTALTPRPCTGTNAASIVLNVDNLTGCDYIQVAELSQPTAFDIAAGTFVQGQFFSLRIFTTVQRALTFTPGAGKFASEGITLPSLTRAGGYVLYGFSYNALSNRWAFATTNQTTTTGMTPGHVLTWVADGAEPTYQAPTGGGGGTGERLLPITAVNFPASDSAILSRGPSSGIPLLRFDNATRQCVSWGPFPMNVDYASNPVFKLQYSMESVTGAFGVTIDVRVMAITPGVDAHNPDNAANYGSVNTCPDTPVPASAGSPKTISCSLTNNDGLLARDLVEIELCRNITHATDTAAGIMQALTVVLEYTR